MHVVISNATIANLSPRQIQHGNLSIVDGRIEQLSDAIPEDADHVVDCSHRLVIPGNVCAHTHLYSALARGMPPPPRTPRDFGEILEYVWWRLDRALDLQAVRLSALVGAIDALHSGTTCLVDHHASPNAIEGSLDVLADGLEEVGVRGIVCYEVTDRNGKGGRDAGLRESERFLRENARPTVRGMVGAHASFTLDDDTLVQLAELAGAFSTGVHIHVAEDICDELDSLRRSGDRTAVRLSNAGILRPDSIAAHGVHLQPPEIDAVRNCGSWLVHNCRSNMNNSVGRAPVGQFGPRSALGTDGIDEDMFAESRTAYFRAREDSLDRHAEQFTDMLAHGGEIVSASFGAPVGALEPGAVADLVILNYDPPTPLTPDNLSWHWMFALSPANVESVMVNGRWVLYRGEMQTVDEERIRAEATSEAKRLWRRMEDQ